MSTFNLADILELPVSERLRLMEEIWDSVVEFPEAVPVTDAQREEINRRIEAYHRDPDAGSPWADVKARLLKS